MTAQLGTSSMSNVRPGLLKGGNTSLRQRMSHEAGFLFASDAWAATKDGSLDASRFGVSAIGITGQRFLAASLMRDQAALLKIELKPWDIWGPALLARCISDKEVLASRALGAVAKRLDAASEIDSDEPPNGYESWDRPVSIVSFPFGEPLQIRLM